MADDVAGSITLSARLSSSSASVQISLGAESVELTGRQAFDLSVVLQHLAALANSAAHQAPVVHETADAAIFRLAGAGSVTAADVAAACGCSRSSASNRLWALCKDGRLSRVGRGVYAVVRT